MGKYANTALLGICAVLLALITYSTGLGKFIPQKEPLHLACDSLLTQQLFYSQLLSKDNSQAETSKNLTNASSIREIEKIVTDNTNIDASRTTFYSSLSNSGDCQAHLTFQHPRQNGSKAAYVPYSISGYAPTDPIRNAAGEMVEEIHINFIGINDDENE